MLSIIAISFATFIVAYLARKAEQSWLAPTAFFALMWAGYLLTVTFFVTDVEMIRGGMLWIFMSIVGAYIGSSAGDLFTAPVSVRHPTIAPPGVRMLQWACRIAAIIGVIDILSLFVARGFSVTGVLSFAIVAQVSAQNRADAYAGDANTSILQRLVFVALFLGTMYGGMLFRLAARSRDKLLAVSTLLLTATLYALFGSRMGVLYGGSFWLAAFLATHVALSNPEKGVSAAFLFRLGISAVVILIGLSTLAQVVRYSARETSLDWYRMVADPFSFVAAFGIWFHQDGLHFSNLLYGGRLFRRLFEFVGVVYEPQAAIEVGFTSSNIYTIFRDLIEDFNPVGSTLFLMLFGFVGRLVFAAAAAGRRGAVPWLILLYSFALTSFASGMLSYTTTTVAMLAFILTFRFIPRFCEERLSATSTDGEQ